MSPANMTPAMDEADWLALCVYEEARGEQPDGQAAVARVVLNRARLRYSSDGSIFGTVTWPTQFSWCEFDMVDGKYQRVCRGKLAIIQRAKRLYAAARSGQPKTWAACAGVSEAVRLGRYVGLTAAYAALTPDVVLYDNLALANPEWALKAQRVTTIGHHAFFRESPVRTGLAR